MDWLTFFSKIIPSVFWPITALILILKKDLLVDILKTFRRVKKVKLAGQEIELHLDLDKDLIQEAIENLPSDDFQYSIIPYVRLREVEEIVIQLETLKALFNIRFCDIQNVSLLKLMAGYYYLKSDFEFSKKYYHQAEEMSRKKELNDEMIYNGLGYSYFRLKDYPRAYRYFAKINEMNKKSPWGYLGLGIVKKTWKEDKTKWENHLKEAIELFQKAIENDPSSFINLFGESLAYIFLDDKKEALNILNNLIEKKPDFALAYYNRAVMNLELKSPTKEVLSDLHTSVNLNPFLRNFAKADCDFDSIRDNSCYKCIIECEIGKYN